MDFIWYIVFSMIEELAVLVMTLHLFRFNASQHWKSIVIASLLFSLLSYGLRVELDFNDYFPVVFIIFSVLYMFYNLNTPIFWSLFISIVASIANFVLQTVLLLLFIWSGYLSLSEVGPDGLKARIYQLVYALVVIVPSYYLYKRGIGFAFNFDRFRWKAENLIIFIVAVILFIFIMIMFIHKNVYYFAIFVLLLSALLIYLAVKKERDDLD